MNPPSDTPRTDALNEALLESGATGERSAHSFYKHAKVLERELASATRGCDANHAVAQLLQQQIDGLQEQLTACRARESGLREVISSEAKGFLDLAEWGICNERLGGNIAKEENWKGQLLVAQAILAVLSETPSDSPNHE